MAHLRWLPFAIICTWHMQYVQVAGRIVNYQVSSYEGKDVKYEFIADIHQLELAEITRNTAPQDSCFIDTRHRDGRVEIICSVKPQQEQVIQLYQIWMKHPQNVTNILINCSRSDNTRVAMQEEVRSCWCTTLTSESIAGPSGTFSPMIFYPCHQIQLASISRVPNIIHLYLRHVNIVPHPIGIFSRVLHVESLHLQNTNLTIETQLDFCFLPLLINLTFCHNDLKAVPKLNVNCSTYSNGINFPQALILLVIESEGISSLPNEPLLPLAANMSVLSLHDNFIVHLPPLLLRGLTSLLHVDLRIFQ